MNTIWHVLKNSLLNLIAGISQRIGQTVIFILIARMLSLEETGAYKLAITYTSLLLALSFWGLDQLLIREIARDRASVSRYLSTFLILRLILASLLWLGLLAVVPLLPYSAESRYFILIMALTIIPDSITNIYQSVWIAFENVKSLSLIILFFSFIRLIGGALLLWSEQALVQIAYLFLFVSIAEMLVNAWLTHRREDVQLHWQIDPSFWLQSLRTATPLIIISFVLLVEYQFDTVILSLFWPEEEVGIYGTAATLFTLLLLLTRSYQLAIFPLLSRAYHSSQIYLQRVYSHSVKYLLIGALLIAMGVTLLSESIIRLVYGIGNEEAAPILSVLVWAFVLSAFNVPNSRLLIVAERQRVVAYFAILSMSGNLVLNLLLVPQLGGLGAAWARVLAMPLYSIPAFFYVQYRICPISWRDLIQDDFFLKQRLRLRKMN